MGVPLSRSSSIEKMTSSTVTGWPSENLASGLRVNSTQLRSGGVSDGLGDQAVERVGLVGAPRQQGFKDEIAEHRVLQAASRGRATLDDHRVEAVEGADHAVGDLAALGGIGIGVGQVIEVCGKRGIAGDGDAVHRHGRGKLRDKPETEGRGNRGGERAAQRNREIIAVMTEKQVPRKASGIRH